MVLVDIWIQCRKLANWIVKNLKEKCKLIQFQIENSATYLTLIEVYLQYAAGLKKGNKRQGEMGKGEKEILLLKYLQTQKW